MSFFRREEGGLDPAQPMSRTPDSRHAAAVTLVAPGTRVDGKITGATEVRVDGEVVGEVDVSGQVAIGSAGKVDGRVSARNVQVAGTMQGDIRASERIVVEASGVAHGNLSASRVVIAEGAFFKGKVEMGGRSQDRAPGTPPAPAGAKEGS